MLLYEAEKKRREGKTCGVTMLRKRVAGGRGITSRRKSGGTCVRGVAICNISFVMEKKGEKGGGGKSQRVFLNQYGRRGVKSFDVVGSLPRPRPVTLSGKGTSLIFNAVGKGEWEGKMDPVVKGGCFVPGGKGRGKEPGEEGGLHCC